MMNSGIALKLRILVYVPRLVNYTVYGRLLSDSQPIAALKPSYGTSLHMYCKGAVKVLMAASLGKSKAVLVSS